MSFAATKLPFVTSRLRPVAAAQHFQNAAARATGDAQELPNSLAKGLSEIIGTFTPPSAKGSM